MNYWEVDLADMQVELYFTDFLSLHYYLFVVDYTVNFSKFNFILFFNIFK